MILLSIILTIVYWLSETFIHAYVFQQGTFSHWLFPADTNEIWMRLVIVLLFLGLGLIAQRLLDQRAHEAEQVKASEERFRQLAEHIHEVFWMVDHGSSRVIYVSPAYETIWGRSCESLYDSPVSRYEAIHADDRDRIIKALGKQEKGEFDEEYRIMHPDGSVRWIHDRAFPIRNKSGEVYRIAGLAKDITRHKLAELARRESELRLKRVIMDAPIPVMLHAEDGEILMVNQKWSDLSGYPREQIPTIGKWTEKAYGKNRREIENIIRSLYRKGAASRNGEFQIRTAQGERRIWDFYSTPMGKLPDGRRFIVSMAMDVTARKKAEQQCRLVINGSPIAIFLFDSRMRFIDANPAGEKLLGYSRRELLSMSIPQVDVDPDHVRPAHDRLARGEPLINFEHRLRTKDGRIITVLNNSVAMRNPEENDTIFWYSFLMDISERKRIEEELEEERELLQHIADSIPGVPYIYDLVEHRVIYTNESLARVLGYRREEIEKPEKGFLHAFMHPADLTRFLQLLSRHETAGDHDVVETEFRLRHADNTWRWFTSRTTSFSRLADGRPGQIIGIIQDITEQKQISARMERLASENRRLLQALILARDRERHRIARELHDELGQNLTVIRTEIGRALARCRPDPELAGILQTIDDASTDVIRCTRNIYSGLHPTMIESIGPDEALRHLVKNWKLQSGIKCVFRLNGSLRTLDSGVSLAAYRILQECLTNIARHAGASRVLIRCSRMRKGEINWLHMTVEDNGCGMNTQEHSPSSFGLVSMRERAHALSGSFSLQSAPGAGTRIDIELPFRESGT